MSIHKAQELARQATRAAEFRGHRIGSFVWSTIGADPKHTRTYGSAKCLDCGKGIHVDTRPAPNGIDISGEAVVLACQD